MSAHITVLSNNDQVEAFRTREPDGYTILNGDRGVGLTGELAEQARNAGGDPTIWIRLAEQIGPAVHAAE